MAEIECVYCGDFFEGSPRHKNQTCCEKKGCKNAKKAAWQRHKMKTDPDYRANQKSSQKRWVQENPRRTQITGKNIAGKTLKRRKGIGSCNQSGTEGRGQKTGLQRWIRH